MRHRFEEDYLLQCHLKLNTRQIANLRDFERNTYLRHIDYEIRIKKRLDSLRKIFRL
jgi:hypothetical protein